MEHKLNAECSMEVGELEKKYDTSAEKGKPPTTEDLDQNNIQEEKASSSLAGKEGPEFCNDQDPGKHDLGYQAQDQIGNYKDFSNQGLVINTDDPAGAIPKVKDTRATFMEGLQQDITNGAVNTFCKPQEGNPSFQDDIDKQEQKSGSLMYLDLLSLEDELVTSRRPDDEGGTQGIGMSEVGEVYQPVNPYDRQDLSKEGQYFKTEIDKLNEKFSFILKSLHRQFNIQLKHDKDLEYLKNVISDLQGKMTSKDKEIHYLKEHNCKLRERIGCCELEHDHDKITSRGKFTALERENNRLLKAHGQQSLKVKNDNVKKDEELQLMKRDIANLKGELNSLKAALNPPLSGQGLDHDVMDEAGVSSK